MNRYLITFTDGSSEEVSSNSVVFYIKEDETIARISFYDKDENLIACYSGDWVKSYKRIERED